MANAILAGIISGFIVVVVCAAVKAVWHKLR